jgi:hypothetical protein
MDYFSENFGSQSLECFGSEKRENGSTFCHAQKINVEKKTIKKEFFAKIVGSSKKWQWIYVFKV